MELYLFLGFVVLIVSILQIILFFKVWGMTNDVEHIKTNICSTDGFEEFAWTGRDGRAYDSLCQSMYKALNEAECWRYICRGRLDELPNGMDYSIKTVESIIKRYEKHFEAIGMCVPEHLSSIEKMNEFGIKLNNKVE